MMRSSPSGIIFRPSALAAAAVLFMGLVSNLPAIFQGVSDLIASGATVSYEEENEFVKRYIKGGDKYYGKFGNCYIVLPLGMMEVLGRDIVGGYEFVYNGGIGFKVYYSDTAYSLLEAYEKGYLSSKALAEFHYEYTHIWQFDIKRPISPVSILDHEAHRIVYYRIKDKEIERGKQYRLECYGKSNGVYAIMFGEGSISGADTAKIKGFEFIYPDSRRIEIYKNEKVYSLTEAYAKGIIDKAYLEKVFNEYKKANSDLYK